MSEYAAVVVQINTKEMQNSLVCFFCKRKPRDYFKISMSLEVKFRGKECTRFNRPCYGFNGCFN